MRTIALCVGGHLCSSYRTNTARPNRLRESYLCAHRNIPGARGTWHSTRECGYPVFLYELSDAQTEVFSAVFMLGGADAQIEFVGGLFFDGGLCLQQEHAELI